MPDRWTIIARTPEETHVYLTDLVADDTTDPARPSAWDGGAEAALVRVKDDLSFPEDWVSTPGWDLSLSPGRPHDSVMESATVHDETA